MKVIASSIRQGKRLDTVYHMINLIFAKQYTSSTLPDIYNDDAEFYIATPHNVPLGACCQAGTRTRQRPA